LTLFPALGFLYIDPLKQGLKLLLQILYRAFIAVFIHRSIKTRIETHRISQNNATDSGFLYIDPLKQGLKHQGIE